MDILNISKENREVTMTLSADELVKICNIFYAAQDKDKTDTYYSLYGDMMLARDLCQYGHIDNFCLSNIAKCRNTRDAPNESPVTSLPDADIKTFNAYIEQNDMPTAFGNSDWNSVYRKIVDSHHSEKIKKWMESKT